MSKLLQLDNGDWIDPNEVTSVQHALQETIQGATGGIVFPPRVIVIADKEVRMVLEYASDGEAQEKCEKLGKLINKLRS